MKSGYDEVRLRWFPRADRVGESRENQQHRQRNSVGLVFTRRHIRLAFTPTVRSRMITDRRHLLSEFHNNMLMNISRGGIFPVRSERKTSYFSDGYQRGTAARQALRRKQLGGLLSRGGERGR